jgi:phosphoenolpyruvate carboxykinase (ATP)
MPRSPGSYANLLIKRLAEFDTQVYLVNTGWTGGSGAPGGSGSRFPIPVTRAIVSACQSGDLLNSKVRHLDDLNLDIPLSIPGVDDNYLNPRDTWENKLDYDNESSKLAKLFSENFKQFNVDESIIAAGPIEVSK